MKTKGLFLAILSIFLLLGTSLSSVSAAENTLNSYVISDMDPTEFGFWQIDDFVSADIMDGFMDPSTGAMSIQPNKNITRAEFTKILINALGIEVKSLPQTFQDVKSDKWYYDYINTANSLGIVQGFSPSEFKPGSNITRGQMAAMIVRAFEDTVSFPSSTGQIFPDVPYHARFASEINKAAALGIVTGFGDYTFRSSNLANRAQAVVVMFRALSNESAIATTEAEVTAVVTDYLTREGANHNDMDLAYDIMAQYTTGYYLADGSQINGDYKNLVSNGYDVSLIGDVSAMQLSVDFLSDRFAEIIVTGTTNTAVIIDSNGERFEKTSNPNDGKFFLKKMIDGSWKVYNFYPQG